jgi:hypothetical protein
MKRNNKALFYESNCKVIMQLYDLNKRAKKREVRLPMNDFRIVAIRKTTWHKSTSYLIPLRKAFVRIAALW